MKPSRSLFLMLIASALLLSQCNEEGGAPQHAPSIVVPTHFPEMLIPEDNPMSVAKIALGRRLFFDPVLSIDSSVSCASCHLPNLAFTDGKQQSDGALGHRTERNAPSLMNIGFHPILMREGAVPSLELQVLSPLEGEEEMAHNIVLVCERLNLEASYKDQFEAVFGDEVTPFTITRALAAFERTLIGGDAPYDRYLLGDSGALSPQQLRGLELFRSDELACASCHSGVLLTDFSIQNNGTYSEYKDPGLYRLTLDRSDVGKFKTPSLRNIELTAPYMHDGSMADLDDVLDHYQKGGSGHPNQSDRIRGFPLSDEDRAALLAFFAALTEESVNRQGSAPLH